MLSNKVNSNTIVGLILLILAFICLLSSFFATTTVNAKITGIANPDCIISTKDNNSSSSRPSGSYFASGSSYNVQYQINGKIYNKTTGCMKKLSTQTKTINLSVLKLNSQLTVPDGFLFVIMLAGFIFGPVLIGIGTGIIKVS